MFGCCHPSLSQVPSGCSDRPVYVLGYPHVSGTFWCSLLLIASVAGVPACTLHTVYIFSGIFLNCNTSTHLIICSRSSLLLSLCVSPWATCYSWCRVKMLVILTPSALRIYLIHPDALLLLKPSFTWEWLRKPHRYSNNTCELSHVSSLMIALFCSSCAFTVRWIISLGSNTLKVSNSNEFTSDSPEILLMSSRGVCPWRRRLWLAHLGSKSKSLQISLKLLLAMYCTLLNVKYK